MHSGKYQEGSGVSHSFQQAIVVLWTSTQSRVFKSFQKSRNLLIRGSVLTNAPSRSNHAQSAVSSTSAKLTGKLFLASVQSHSEQMVGTTAFCYWI